MKKALVRLLAGAGLSVAALTASSPALAAVAFTLPSDSPFRNAAWALGERFAVGAQSITVTHLGMYDDLADGFTTAGGLDVGIFRESDGALLASTKVTSTDSLIAQFRYKGIGALTLNALTTYRVVGLNQSDNYNSAAPVLTNPAITRLGHTFCQSTTLQFCGGAGQGVEPLYIANFQFNTNGVVPEPGTWAMMIVGFGAVGGSMRLARRTRRTSQEAVA